MFSGRCNSCSKICVRTAPWQYHQADPVLATLPIILQSFLFSAAFEIAKLAEKVVTCLKTVLSVELFCALLTKQT